jgi:hypothetical protein
MSHNSQKDNQKDSIAESYSATIYCNDRLVKIKPDGSAEFFAASFNTHELATIAQIGQLLARLRNKHDIEFEIKQDSFEDPDEILRCYWTKTNRVLKVTGSPARPFNTVEAIDQAVIQRGIFCAKRSLVSQLPKKLPII